MIEENGTVVDVDDQGIWVETIKKSACASCAARNGCGQKLLVSSGEGKRFIFRVNNPNNLNVSVEDDVLIGIQEGAFIKATLFMYLMPLLGLILGALLAQFAGFSEGWVILSAFACLAAGFAFVRYGSQTLFGSYQYQPTLMRII